MRGLALARGVDLEKECEHEREAPERGASIAEEGERDADDGYQSQYHTHIEHKVKEQDACQAVAVDSPEGGGVSLRSPHDA